MADADSGMGSHREGRQQRSEQPKVPGAKGKPPAEESPEQALDETLHRRGKTNKHVGDDHG